METLSHRIEGIVVIYATVRELSVHARIDLPGLAVPIVSLLQNNRRIEKIAVLDTDFQFATEAPSQVLFLVWTRPQRRRTKGLLDESNQQYRSGAGATVE